MNVKRWKVGLPKGEPREGCALVGFGYKSQTVRIEHEGVVPEAIARGISDLLTPCAGSPIMTHDTLRHRAAVIAAIIENTSTDQRGTLLRFVAEHLKANVQGATAALIRRAAEEYGE